MTNNFVYIVYYYDPSMGKEEVLFAFDTFTQAEDLANKINAERGDAYKTHFVRSLRYFKQEDTDDDRC